MKSHLFLPDAADLTGQACAVYGCNLRKSNAVHVTAEQLREQVVAERYGLAEIAERRRVLLQMSDEEA